jgi:NTP pyrophosphatase (non-canonical NTP hydrolase)
MTFDDYEKLSQGTAFYPGRGSGIPDALYYTALGICGEAGEYAEKIKKSQRDGVFDPIAAAKELGDVLWYVRAAANEIGFSLEQIAQINIDKLVARRAANTLGGSGDTR